MIRRANNGDVLAVAKVHITSWRETYPGLLPDEMLARLSIADEAIRWQRMLDHPSNPGANIAFVADQHGAIVGYGSCGDQRSRLLHDRGFSGEITELYVIRDSQRQGVGSALMKAMAKALFERGHPSISLWVLKRNDRARRFYESIGGTLIAEKRGRFIEVGYGWGDLTAG